MRYRRFGRSDLEVSEVGFGVWTLASDWWGVVDDKQGMLHAALDAGINFIDTAPVYGEDGFGEDAARRRAEGAAATRSCSPRSAATTSTPPASTPGQSERPHDWEPASVREQLEASLRRLGTDHIDLYQLHNTRIEPIRDDELWEELEKFRTEGKVRELGVALGPAIGWVDEGLEALRDRAIVSLQTVFNVLEQEPGLTFAAEPDGRRRSGRPHLAGAARVRHALGQDHPRHRVPARRPPRAPQPRQHARQLRQGRDARRSSGTAPAAPSARPRSPGSSPTRRSRPCSPRASSIDDVHRVRGGDRPPAHRRREGAARRRCGHDNFGVTNRYEMPLKSSTGG